MGLLRSTTLAACLLLCSAWAVAAENTLVLGDSLSVQVLYFEPETYGSSPATSANMPTSPPPLAILLAGGMNNEFMARAQFWLGKEMVTRGWAIAVPISDQGRNFFQENGSLMPEIVEQLRKIYPISEQKPLLLGISSGGTAALAIAAQSPEHYLGVIATPGRVLEETEFEDLAGLPIYLRVGEKDDFLWNRMLESQQKLLTDAGAKVNAALVADAHHIFTLDWDEIESWLEGVLQPVERAN